MVASAIVYAGIRILSRSSRVLVDEALPAEELDVVRQVIEHPRRVRAGGLPQAARHGAPAAPATSTCTCSSSRARRSSGPTQIAHEVEGEVRRRLPGAEVLVHIEPDE